MIERKNLRGVRVSVGDIEVNRPVTVTPTRSFALPLERRPADPLAVGPFPQRVVQGYRVDRAGVLGLEVDPGAARRSRALGAVLDPRAWPKPLVRRVASAKPAAQAVPIEALLVWTYRRQQAHKGMMGADELQQLARAERITEDGRSIDGCAAIAERAALGVERVDGGGYRLNRVHPDAETVHERVERLGGAKRGLIIRHALFDTTPPWSAHRPKLVPVINGKGRPRVVYNHHREPVSCPIEWDVAPELVWAQNADYALWHAALVELAATLSTPGLLARHIVGEPNSPAAPWVTVENLTA